MEDYDIRKTVLRSYLARKNPFPRLMMSEEVCLQTKFVPLSRKKRLIKYYPVLYSIYDAEEERKNDFYYQLQAVFDRQGEFNAGIG